MKKKLLMFTLAAMLVTSCVACTSKTPSDNDNSDSKTSTTTSVTKSVTNSESDSLDKNVKSQDIKVDDLKDLTDKGVITGVKDITVEEGTDVDLNELVYADKDIVKSVDIDDSKVNYDKAGSYDVIYTITFNGDKLRDYIDKNKLDVGFDTTGNTVVVKTTVTVTVATKEDAEKAIANGDSSVVTEKTKESVKNDNKSKANDNAVESTPTQSSSSEKSGSSNQNNSSNNNNSGSDNNAGNSESHKSNGNSSSSNSGSSSSNSSSGSSSNSSSGNSSGNTSSSSNSGSSNSSASTEKPQSHSHNYVEVSRVNPTCSSAGSVTYTCSCGATKSESLPATGNHSWVHHDAVTHTEQRVVQEAYDEPVYGYKYVCNTCGAQFEDGVDAIDHIIDNDGCKNYSAKLVQVDTTHHDAVYETVTITDSDAYDECSVCGARN